MKTLISLGFEVQTFRIAATGPIGPIGATGAQGIQGEQGIPGESAPNADLPIVQRVAVNAQYQGGSYPLLLELDRPAPSNCYLQFHRYSSRRRDRGTARNRSMPIRYAFRGIFVDGNSNDFPVIPIPEGETTVVLTATQWDALYRPFIIRGNNSSREWADRPPGYPRWNPVDLNRDNKVIYKFGTCEYVRGVSFRASLMSADTLTIIRHFVTDHGSERVIQRSFIR